MISVKRELTAGARTRIQSGFFSAGLSDNTLIGIREVFAAAFCLVVASYDLSWRCDAVDVSFDPGFPGWVSVLFNGTFLFNGASQCNAKRTGMSREVNWPDHRFDVRNSQA